MLLKQFQGIDYFEAIDPETGRKDIICILVAYVTHKSHQSFLSLWELVTHFGDVLGESDTVTIEAEDSIFQMHTWNKVRTASYK